MSILRRKMTQKLKHINGSKMDQNIEKIIQMLKMNI